MKMSVLFQNCLNASYIQVEDHADVAMEYDGTTLYIYFEASADSTDWKNNLDFTAVPYGREDDIRWFVHRGFLKVWTSVKKYIEPAIKDINTRNIVITGYSHGAALGVLCHEYIWFYRPELRNRLSGYGFGCPKIVWGIVPIILKQRWDNFTVIRNLDDIVTHLPPSVFGYTHIGKMLEIGENGKYTAVDAHRPENILKELQLGNL